MNLEEMQTALKRYGFDSTDPLTSWINAAMHDLEDDFDWPWLETVIENIKVGKGVNTIALPNETLKVITIRDVTNLKKLRYYDVRRFVREISEPTEQGQPEIYTLPTPSQIRLWRVPEQEYTFEAIFQGKTSDLAAVGDVPTTLGNVWPTNTHYPIVQRAAAIALQAENEEERAKSAQEQFDKSLERLRKKFGERELDEPAVVADVMGYGSSERGY